MRPTQAPAPRTPRRRPAWGLSLAALAALAPARARADRSPLDPNLIYNYGENETARSAAMGGALRAMGYGTSSLFLNPAAVPEARLYHIEAQGQVTPETGRNVYGGSIVDSTTSRLAGGFSFHGGFMDRSGGIDRTFIDMRLALAFPVTERFLIGLGGRYLKVTQSGLGPFGQSEVSGGLITDSTVTPPGRAAMVNSVTFDAGLVVKASDSIYIAAVGQNLTYPKNGLLPTIVGGGIGYGGEALSIEVDGVADLNSWEKPTARIGVGAEYVVASTVPIRAGYRYDQGAKLSTVSVGTGYVGPIFSLQAAVKRSISSPGATTVVFSFAYHLDSSGIARPTAPTMEVAQ